MVAATQIRSLSFTDSNGFERPVTQILLFLTDKQKLFPVTWATVVIVFQSTGEKIH